MITVKDFFEGLEDRDALVKLGGGTGFIFIGSADEWVRYSDALSDAKFTELKDKMERCEAALKRAFKAYAVATEEFAKFRPYDRRIVVDDYVTSMGSRCVIFEGDDAGAFWTRNEFLAFVKDGVKPKDEG